MKRISQASLPHQTVQTGVCLGNSLISSMAFSFILGFINDFHPALCRFYSRMTLGIRTSDHTAEALPVGRAFHSFYFRDDEPPLVSRETHSRKHTKPVSLEAGRLSGVAPRRVVSALYTGRERYQPGLQNPRRKKISGLPFFLARTICDVIESSFAFRF